LSGPDPQLTITDKRRDLDSPLWRLKQNVPRFTIRESGIEIKEIAQNMKLSRTREIAIAKERNEHNIDVDDSRVRVGPRLSRSPN
jgi:hypothetical protein